MNFEAWLQAWLKRHPVKTPRLLDPDRFTAQVMARVRAEAIDTQPFPARRVVWGAWALATASAIAVLAVLVVPRQSPLQLAGQIEQDAILLAALDAPLGAEEGVSAEELSRELEDAAPLLLAEDATAGDADWITETMRMLDELEEDTTGAASGESLEDDDNWMDELQMLEDADLAVKS